MVTDAECPATSAAARTDLRTGGAGCASSRNGTLYSECDCGEISGAEYETDGVDRDLELQPVFVAATVSRSKLAGMVRGVSGECWDGLPRRGDILLCDRTSGVAIARTTKTCMAGVELLHRPQLKRRKLHSYAVGRVNRKVLPWLSSLSARMEPPWASMMCLAMARPSPVPPDSRERALSTR